MKTGRVVLRVELVVTKIKAALLLACAAVPFMSNDLASESTPLSVFYPVQYGSNNSVSANYFVAASISPLASLSIGNMPSVSIGGVTVKNVPGIQVVAKDFGNAELVISNGVNAAISGKSAIRIRTKAAGVAKPLAFFPDNGSYQLYLKDFCTWRDTPCVQYETSIMVATDGGLSAEGYWTSTSNEALSDRRQLCCRMTTEQPPI